MMPGLRHVTMAGLLVLACGCARGASSPPASLIADGGGAHASGAPVKVSGFLPPDPNVPFGDSARVLSIVTVGGGASAPQGALYIQTLSDVKDSVGRTFAVAHVYLRADAGRLPMDPAAFVMEVDGHKYTVVKLPPALAGKYPEPKGFSVSAGHTLSGYLAFPSSSVGGSLEFLDSVSHKQAYTWPVGVLRNR